MPEQEYPVLTQIDAINAYQECTLTHPYTCGRNSLHALLIGKEKDGKAIMACPDCDFEQEIDREIVEPYVNGGMKEAMEVWAKRVGMADSKTQEWIDRIKWYQP